jgi:cytochrome b561
MALILIVLLLALLLGGLGFAIHILWWIALIVLVVWVLGFLIRVGEGGSRSRWYRWLWPDRPHPAVSLSLAALSLAVLSLAVLSRAGGPVPIAGPVPGSGRAAASASSTLSYSGNRSARPVIHSALV